MARAFIVEADGASRGNPGPASYGALVADAVTGEVLVELAEGHRRATNNVAEYRGLIAGLRAARELDPAAEVEVRMDSKLAVEQMSGPLAGQAPGRWKLAVEGQAGVPASGGVATRGCRGRRTRGLTRWRTWRWTIRRRPRRRWRR